MQDDLNFDNVAIMQRGARGKERGIAAFLDYWQRMRKCGDVPRRADIDPRGIEPLLENAFICEKIAPGLARLRIAGTHLADLMGMEVRGMPVSAFFAPDDRKKLGELLVELFDRPAILKIGITAAGGIGRPALTGSMLILPLRSDLGDVSRALGCLVTNGSIGRSPRRFSLQSHTLTPLILPAMIPPAAAQPNSPQPGFAAPAPVFHHSPTELGSERPYLRLVRPE